MRTCFLVVLAIVNLSTTGCQDHTWERSRQCAQDADRLAKRLEWNNPAQRPIPVSGWVNHYNPKFGKCFVLVSYTRAADDRSTPYTYDQLMDAHDGSVLASFHEDTLAEQGSGKAYCSITESGSAFSACAAAKAYVYERMEMK